MDDATRLALLEHDRRFYSAHAGEFDAKRERPWPGFARAFGAVPEATPLRVLDLGCGNARLAAYLHARVGERLAYLGIDHSAPLLQHAVERLPSAARPHVQLRAGELLDASGTPRLPDGEWELVTLLGVLHHVPSTAARRALIRAAFARLAPGGRLVLTVWRFMEEPRLRARVIAFDDARALALLPALDRAQLEPGDVLLRWGTHDAHASEPSVRYCHAAAYDEVSAWLHGLPEPRERFFADGASGTLNEYLVLARE